MKQRNGENIMMDSLPNQNLVPSKPLPAGIPDFGDDQEKDDDIESDKPLTYEQLKAKALEKMNPTRSNQGISKSKTKKKKK